MPEYSKEQVRRIIAGLATGKRPGHRPMSDAEFLTRYDPVGSREAQVLDTLEQIRVILLSLQEGFQFPKPPYRAWQDNKTPQGQKPAGPIEV